MIDVDGAAARLFESRASGRTLDVLLSEEAPLSLAEAYAVQDALTARRLATGDRVVGWKLGYTSVAMREQMGIAEPNRGPLTASMLLRNGGAVPPTALQPKVEPEIGLWLARRVPPGAGIDEVLACCVDAIACIEVVDSVWTGYRFTLADNTADGSSAARVVLGPSISLNALDEVRVSLQVDGGPVLTATGAAADGHPALGVGWLARQLADHPRGLRPGDLIITGGLTAALPLERGSLARASFSTASSEVTVRR